MDKIDFTTLNFGNYSTSEQDTGFTWVDGKHIYKKTVNFGALPDSTNKTVAHGISNLSRVIKIEGTSYRPDQSKFTPLPSPGVSDSTYSTNLQMDATGVTIFTGFDRSNETAYVTIYYTKSNA